MPCPPRLEVLAQPFGGRALGTVVIDELRVGHWESFRAVVAFLKRSGLVQVAGPLNEFLRRGAEVVISVGIDHDGTSLEGLQDLWRVMNGRGELYVFKEGQGGQARTFHPKTYIFEDSGRARALVGSGNLTAGGLFANHELAVSVDLDLTDTDSRVFHSALRDEIDRWQTPSPACLPVDASLLKALFESGSLLPESEIRRASGLRAPALGEAGPHKPQVVQSYSAPPAREPWRRLLLHCRLWQRRR